MSKSETNWPIRGHLIVPSSRVDKYRGVDRSPFVPILVEAELDPTIQRTTDNRVWTFYPPGWRREAFRIYEQNLVKGIGDELDLVTSEEVASRIKEIIEPHLGFHEILACEIWSPPLLPTHRLKGGLGYDIAYLGGDFYSAILNGLFRHPSPALVLRYQSHLNQFDLFDEPNIASDFINNFKQAAPSEKNSDFYVWLLSLA